MPAATAPSAPTAHETFQPGDETAEDISTFFNLDKAGFNFVFDLNLMGTLLPTQVFAVDMLGQPGCCILNISSLHTPPAGTSYTAETMPVMVGICRIFSSVTGSLSPYQRNVSFMATSLLLFNGQTPARYSLLLYRREKKTPLLMWAICPSAKQFYIANPRMVWYPLHERR